MTDLELKNLWRATHQKLEEALAANQQNHHDITRMKIRGFLDSMQPIKIFTLLVGLAWVGVGGIALGHIYVYAFAEANKFFLYSASFQVLATAVAWCIYVYQLALIQRVETFGPVWETQRTLARLRTSTLWATRILCLQLPAWTTFWWNSTMFAHWHAWQWAVALAVTISFSALAIWLFANIRYENRDKKWFAYLFSGREWTPLLQSMALLDELEAHPENEQTHA